MKSITVQIDDEIAATYAEEARERQTTVEALLASVVAEGAQDFGDPLTPDQIASIEAGLVAERAGRLVSRDDAEARLAQRRVS